MLRKLRCWFGNHAWYVVPQPPLDPGAADSRCSHCGIAGLSAAGWRKYLAYMRNHAGRAVPQPPLDPGAADICDDCPWIKGDSSVRDCQYPECSRAPTSDNAVDPQFTDLELEYLVRLIYNKPYSWETYAMLRKMYRAQKSRRDRRIVL